MNRTQFTEVSMRLSWLLRHGARATGLVMDAAGWVAVEDVLRLLELVPAALRRVVVQDQKPRCSGRAIACAPARVTAPGERR